VTRARFPFFADERIALTTVDLLRTLATDTGTQLHAHCVMPDHVHLLLEVAGNCDLIAFVGRFKNLTQRAAWTHGRQGRIWQRSFWDRFLREEDQLEAAVRYILDNPVRRGLVTTRDDYCFSGALQRPSE
jgi:putative transposase